MRHASAEGIGSDGTDLTRALTAIGDAEASIQGHFLGLSGIVPQFVGTSSAQRAQSTGERVLDALGKGPELTVAESLYNASGVVLLAYIQSLPHNADTALLVAHMPGVAELLAMVTSEFAEVTIAYSPATLSCVTFPDATSWEDAVLGSGRLEWLLPPMLLPA